jgi:SAM-dependent methyltransferase
MNQETRRNQQFYESFAEYYPAVYAFLDAPATVAQWVNLLETEGLVAPIEKRLQSPPRLLDAGCGPGWFLTAWAAAGFEVTGVDSSPTMLRLASEGWNHNRPGHACALVQADLCEPETIAGFRESFECVVGHSHLPNLMHPDDLPRLFQSVAACLRPGGIWAFDHSRIVSTLPVGDEEHQVSLGDVLVRTSSYDKESHRCLQSWRGAVFAGEEVCWFPEIEHFDIIANQHGLQLRRRLEWAPNQVNSPFLPVSQTSERLLSVYRKR